MHQRAGLKCFSTDEIGRKKLLYAFKPITNVPATVGPGARCFDFFPYDVGLEKVGIR